MKTFGFGLICILTLPPAAQSADAPTNPITVPFELLKSGHMAVKIQVNGKGPYRVIFDTGAPICLLNNKIAKDAGLLKNLETPLFNLFGTMGQVSVKSIELGDVKAKEVNTIIMDHPTVEAISRALGPIEGIVGFPFFARYRMTLDYQAKELTFVPNGFKPPDVLEKLMESMMGARGGKADATVLSPAGLWGMSAKAESQGDQSQVKIAKIYPASAAKDAGLEEGDRIVSVQGRWTDSVTDLYSAAGVVKPGTKAKIVIERKGKEMELTLTPRLGF